MKRSPKLSVIMGVHNGLPFLREAVESVLNQTYRDFEFIVVDDGSSDDSWAVLTEYAARDARMVLLRHPSRRGVASARNTAFRVARGEYLACQDADDISHPDRFSRQIEFLDERPEVGLLGTWPVLIDENGQRLVDMGFPRLSQDRELQRHLLDNSCFCAGSVVIRHQCLRSVGGYDEALSSSEDYDLWLRLAEVTRLANLPAYLYLYRRHSDSISRRHRYELMWNKAIALERAVARRHGATPPERLRRLLARDYLRAAFVGYTTGDLSEARRSVHQAVRWLPRILHAGSFLESVVWSILHEEPIEDALRHAKGLLTEVIPATRHVMRVRSRILSRLHMQVVFEALDGGDDTDFGRHWWRGVRHDLRWLLNRGVWAIGMRHLLARPDDKRAPGAALTGDGTAEGKARRAESLAASPADAFRDGPRTEGAAGGVPGGTQKAAIR